LQDSFQYQVRDDGGAVGVGTVLVVVGGVSDPPYQNAANHADVNGDGFISPMDPLILINYINANGPGPIPAGLPRPPYLDVNGDGSVSTADVIIVVNALNTGAAAGEGEAAPEATPALSPQSVTATPAAWGVSSFSTLNAPSATAFSNLLPAEDRSEISDWASWNRVCTAAAQPVSADPQRSVFDAWDADESAWEDTLATIAEGDSGTDRESATDALLGSLFG
jgi:hypothetical protein